MFLFCWSSAQQKKKKNELTGGSCDRTQWSQQIAVKRAHVLVGRYPIDVGFWMYRKDQRWNECRGETGDYPTSLLMKIR